MSISGISSAGSDVVNGFKQRRQQFESLIAAVKSGDVSAAQKALATLQQNTGADSSTQSASTNPRHAAFAALASAVNSGDIAGAQKALSTWQAARSNAVGSANGGTAATTDPSRDKFTSDFASIFAAVQSGDMSGAQQALKALQTDATTLYGPQSQSPASTSTASTGPKSPLDADVQSLFSSVQSGDATAAKAALDKLMADAAATAVKHGHHHHHGGGSGSATGGVVSASDATAATTASSSAASQAGDKDGDGDSR